MASRLESLRWDPMYDRCQWLNEPSQWRLGADVLSVVTDAGTDFWRETHYGFTRDSGHAFGREVPGDFTVEVKVEAAFRALYDQAGLMIRTDPETWIKAGVELSDGQARFSSVLTAGRSDWSIGPEADPNGAFWLRATVGRGVLRLQYSTDRRVWPLLRLAPFPVATRYWAGPMCCTPERGGLHVDFRDFQVGPPSRRDLHDLG